MRIEPGMNTIRMRVEAPRPQYRMRVTSSYDNTVTDTIIDCRVFCNAVEFDITVTTDGSPGANKLILPREGSYIVTLINTQTEEEEKRAICLFSS